MSEQRANLRAGLAAFRRRFAKHPGIGVEVERRGAHSYRVFTIGRGLPYLIWYVYDAEDPNGPVSLLMLLHEAQDRQRFDEGDFD